MWANPQETADLVTFTEEIPYENIFLCSDDISERHIIITETLLIDTINADTINADIKGNILNFF